MAKKVKEVIAIIEANGWYHVRTTGGHRMFEHPTNPRTVTVAGKRSETMPVGTLAGIRRDTGLKELR